MTVAGRALTQNITLVAPVILPMSEHVKWIRNFLLKNARNYVDKVITGKPLRKKKEKSGDKDKASEAAKQNGPSGEKNTQEDKAEEALGNPIGNWFQVLFAVVPALISLIPIRTPVFLCKLWQSGIPRVPNYTPNFKTCITHWCIHAGGRAVIDAMQSNLSLSEFDVEPSRRTLERFGNTSSSSVWYELAFIESTKRIKPGQQIFQIAFGSGFKCNSAVLQAVNVGCDGGRQPTAFPLDELLPEMLSC